MSDEKQHGFSRRKFLASAATVTAGALVSGGAMVGLSPLTAKAAAPAIPWAYQPLDIELVRQRAYNNYFVGGCMYASAKALLDSIFEVVGSPWDSIPADMFKFGKGGALSWGTLCGALNGSLAVIELAAGASGDALGHELMGWYGDFPFPSNKLDAIAHYPGQIQTVSKSPLCHTSVSIWCDAANATVNSDQKKDRCAKLAGDTAARAAELLNQWKAGTFVATYQPSAEFTRCMTCHVGTTSKYDLNYSQLF